MGRKEQEQARNQSQALFDFQMGQTKEQAGVQKAGREMLQPKAQQLSESTGYSQDLKQSLARATQSEGYSPEEQSAITQDTTGAVSSAFGKARQGMTRRAAATGNTAGYNASVADLAREESKALGASTRSNKLAFAEEARQRVLQNLGLKQGFEDEQQRRQEQGLRTLASLYGIDVGAFTSGRNAAMYPLQNYSNLANQKGFGSKFQDAALGWAFG